MAEAQPVLDYPTHNQPRVRGGLHAKFVTDLNPLNQRNLSHMGNHLKSRMIRIIVTSLTAYLFN